MIESQAESVWLYTCEKCGKSYKYAKRKTFICCGHQPRSNPVRKSQGIANCPHRGPVLVTINARSAGCGCSSTTVEVYQCERFNEPVLKQAADHCREKIATIAPGYTGRTCRGCNPDAADILHVTPRPDWQRILSRGRFALGEHGIMATAAELVRPTAEALRERLSHDPPRLVFVHAFNVPAAAVLSLARQHRDTRFVFACHSHETHLFTWAALFAEMRQALDATRMEPNIWYAGPLTHWRELGYERAIRWEWPCRLPRWQEPPRIDPPTLLITSRVDLVKAIPAQLIAAVLLQRRHGCRVALSLPVETGPREQAIQDTIAAAGLMADRWHWAGEAEFERRLRERVSIVLQPSMSETFNYVSLEAGAAGRPWVGSAAIEHTPDGWRADPNDPADIARVGQWLLANYNDASFQARQIAERVTRRNNAAYADVVGGLLR